MSKSYDGNESINIKQFINDGEDVENFELKKIETRLQRSNSDNKKRHQSDKKLKKKLSNDSFDLPDFLSLTSENGPTVYNDNFNWNIENPWLSTYPEYGYIPLKQQGNYGFYWLWRSSTSNSPTLIHMIGGPGRSVLKKAFGGYNPLIVNKKKSKLSINRHSATDRYNLLYIECPIGSGYSVTTKQSQIKNFDELASSVEEIAEYLFKKHPSSKGGESFYIGDGFCGLEIPVIVTRILLKYKNSIKGIFLENPIIDPIQNKNINVYFNKNEDDPYIFNQGHYKKEPEDTMQREVELMEEKEKCKGCNLFGKAFSFMETWKKNIEYRNTRAAIKEKQISAKRRYCKGKQVGRQEINNFISSCEFRILLEAKKVLNEDDLERHVDIDYYEKKFSSVDLISDLIKKDIHVVFISGCKDYVYPDWSQEKALQGCQFSFKDSFLKSDWKKYGSFGVMKREKNVQWIKHKTAGHCLFADYPNWLSRTIMGCLYEISYQDQDQEC